MIKCVCMNLTDLKSKQNIYGCFVLSGDSFLMKKAIEHIKYRLNFASDFDVPVFDSENFSITAIIESCEQVSFFSMNKLVIIKNVTQILENDKKKLLDYIGHINPNCTLLIIDSDNVFDFLKVEKWNFTLPDYEIFANIQEFAKQNGKTISQQNAFYLTTLLGKDLGKLLIDIEKLSAYSLNAEITKEEIDGLVTKTDDVIIFELTSALGQKRADKSLSILDTLIKKEAMPVKFLPLISNTFSRLFTVCLSKDLTDDALAQKLGIKPYAVTKLRAQAKNFTAPQLKNIVYMCCEVEYMIKGGLMQAETALIYLAIYILNI